MRAVVRVRAWTRAAARPAGPPPIIKVSTTFGRGGMVVGGSLGAVMCA